MKKFDKRVFTYFIIMLCCVILLLVFAYLSGEKIETMENDLADKVSVHEKITLENQDKITELSNKVKELENENKKLKEMLDENSIVSNGETYQQSMKILSDIYLLIENKEFEKAKKELEKFDTTGADDTVLNFKKALENLIK